MAEYVCAPTGKVFAIPDSMSFEDAAALPLNYLTAYQILFDVGHLKEGDSVLVHMAGGGVVSIASQTFLFLMFFFLFMVVCSGVSMHGKQMKGINFIIFVKIAGCRCHSIV